MPTRKTDFAFVEEGFDPSEYPDEITPTVGSDRFPFTVPKAKIASDTLSKTAVLLRERIAEIRGIASADVPEGLLRAVEAADAWPDENVKNFAAGRTRSISTEVGEAVYVEMWANPMVLVHDPNNGRTIGDARAKGLPYLEAVRDDVVTGAPVIKVGQAAQFITGVDETAGALGFTGNVTDAKDLQDLNWVGLQGVHEAALTTPTLVEDEDGNATWVLKQDDGNRRLAIERRCIRQATGLSMSEIESWSDHLLQPEGSRQLRHWTAGDVENVRRKAAYKDAAYWRPASGSPDAISEWLAGAKVAQRTVIRCSVMPIRLVIGYRNVRQSAARMSAAAEVIHRYIRRTHIKAAAQKEWSSAVQAMQVALDSMRRIMARFDTTTGYTMALGRAELEVVYSNRVVTWTGTDADDPCHPLRLAAKSIATFVCSDTNADWDVKQSLIAHALSTHHTKLRENRASVAASVAMPILDFMEEDKADYNRARATVDRASRHPMFVSVKRHPDGATDPWWAYLDRPVADLHALADQEFDAGKGTDDSPDEKSVGSFGPATRALLFLATIGQATNPAFRNPEAGEQATPWQLTQNGMGGMRGLTATGPDLVMRQVLARHKKAGVTQLVEIVRAALAADFPSNTIDPAYVELRRNGQPDTRTAGTITERYLRSEAMGWTGKDGGKGTVVPAADPFDRALDALKASVAGAAANTLPFRDDADVRIRFLESGLPETYTTTLLRQAKRIVKLLEQGQYIASQRAGMAAFDFDDEDDES